MPGELEGSYLLLEMLPFKFRIYLLTINDWMDIFLIAWKPSIFPLPPMAFHPMQSKGRRPLFGPQNGPTTPLTASPTTLPLVYSVPATHPPYSSSNLLDTLPFQGFTSHFLVCPDFTSPCSLLLMSSLNYQCNGEAFSGYHISNNNFNPTLNTPSPHFLN